MREPKRHKMKTILTSILILVSGLTFSQEIKVETSDTSCVTILRNTFGCKQESNTNGVFIFSFCNEARVATNLASKKEGVDYKLIKLD